MSAEQFARKWRLLLPAASGISTENEELLDPDLMLPEQFFSLRRLPETPEIYLLISVLEHAIACCCGMGEQGKSSYRARQALEWIKSPDKSWPFSFINVCLALDLDPKRVRAWVELSAKSLASKKLSSSSYQQHTRLKLLVPKRHKTKSES